MESESLAKFGQEKVSPHLTSPPRTPNPENPENPQNLRSSDRQDPATSDDNVEGGCRDSACSIGRSRQVNDNECNTKAQKEIKQLLEKFCELFQKAKKLLPSHKAHCSSIAGHFGAEKIIAHFRRHASSMAADATTFVQTCTPCCLSKPKSHKQ